MTKIAVDPSLSNIQQALRDKGYDVIELKEEADSQSCDFCVVTGLDSNVMGIQDTSIEASIIDADGMTADQVCQEIDQKLHS